MDLTNDLEHDEKKSESKSQLNQNAGVTTSKLKSNATFPLNRTDDPSVDSNSALHKCNDDISPLDTDTRQMLRKVKQCMLALQSNETGKVLTISKLNELEMYFKREAYDYDDIVSDLNEKHDQSLIYEFCDNTLCDITIFHTLDSFTSSNDTTENAKSDLNGTHAMQHRDIRYILDEPTIGAASNADDGDRDVDAKDDHEGTDDDMSSGQRSIERETEEYMQQFSDGEIHSFKALLKTANTNQQTKSMHITAMEFDELLDDVLSHTEQEQEVSLDEDHAETNTEEDDEEKKSGSYDDTSHMGTDTSNGSDEDVIYCGYLWKESVFKNRFHQHWAHITEQKLQIFETKTDSEPMRMYDLTFYIDVNVISESTDDVEHWDFQLIAMQTSSKQIFRANTAQEMNEWIQYIKQCQPTPEPELDPEPVLEVTKIDVVDQKEEPIQADDTAQKVELFHAEDLANTPSIDSLDDADNNQNNHENEDTNRQMEIISSYASVCQATQEIKQNTHVNPGASDDIGDNAQSPVIVQPDTNPSSTTVHDEDNKQDPPPKHHDIHETDEYETDEHEMNKGKVSLNSAQMPAMPQLEMLTHQQSDNWRRSLMNTDIKQTVYKDPDAEEDAKESSQDPTTKLNQKTEEERRIDYEYDEQYTTRFTMKWQNIIHAIKQELYNKIAKRINNIVERKDNEIDQNDLSEDTVNKVLNILSETKQSVGKEEYRYIKQLVQRAARFKPCIEGLTTKQPQITPRRFSYRFDFDKKGLLFCLGTNGTLKASDYQNPTKRQLVKVFSSPLSDGYLRAFVGRRDEECTTRSQRSAFMAVHLKNAKIRLMYYTLRYYSWDCGAPRNWNLEASNNNRSWYIIKEHANDASLKKRGDAFTWKVTCSEYYSYFRIRSTGGNASVSRGTDYRLSSSGMELYGDAYGGAVIISTDVHPRYPMLTIAMLQDIYDLHRSFRYMHYHFEDYKWEQYIKEVMDQIYLELPNNHRGFQFNPSYVVNDDLFCVFQYIFGVSLYINQIMDSMTTRDEFKLFVIGRSVQCVYDDKIIFPYNMNDVGAYLSAHSLPCGQCTVNDPNDIADVSNIASFIRKARIRLNPDRADLTDTRRKWNKNKSKQKETMRVLIIVDRRKDKDVIYVAE
eukprot:152302_1